MLNALQNALQKLINGDIDVATQSIDFTKPIDLKLATSKKNRPTAGTNWFKHSGDKYPGLHLAVGKTKAMWYLRARVDGKPSSIRIGALDDLSPDAALKQARAKAQHSRNEATREIRTVVDAWQEYCQDATASERHLNDLASKLNRNAAAIMRKHPADVSLLDVRRCLMSIESVSTRHHVKAALNSAFSILDIPSPIPRGKLKAKQLGKVGKRTTLWKDFCDAHAGTDRHDWSPIWKAITAMGNASRRDAWIVMLFTGIRATDVRSLTWDQVDFARRELRFEGLKNGEDRNIPVCDTVMLVLKSRRSNHTHVFAADSQTGYIDHLDTLMHPTVKQDTGTVDTKGKPILKGIPILRQHDTRRHFTSACGPARVPSYAAAYLRGDITSNNSDDDMLMHYGEDLDLHACAADIERIMIDRIGDSFDAHELFKVDI